MRAEDWLGKLLLGRYRPVHVLAQGGQGVVYLARAEGGVGGFVRPVVVKRILPDGLENENNTRLFLREAKLLSEMDHPNILDIIDLDEVDGQYVMVLEYVRGADIGRWARFLNDQRRGFAWDLAVHACALVADALHYVHTRRDAEGASLGIIHRDVTPANILIDVEGTVKLADFGIARRQGDKTEQINGSDVVRGNFSFVAPEVFVGTPPTPAADIYSLGMVLHWLVSGTRAQAGKTLEATVFKAIYETPQRLDEASLEVPSALADVVEQAIQKDPLSRVPSAAELAERLRATLPPGTPQRFAATVQSDLTSAAFGAFGKAISLAELDAMWRDYVPPSEAPEVVVPAAATGRAEGGGPRRLLVAVFGGFALALIGVGVWWRLSTPAVQEPSQFILVRGDVSAVGAGIDERAPATGPTAASPTSPEGLPSDAPPSEDPAPPREAPASAASAERPQPRAEVTAATLTRTFSQRRGAIRQCADRHSEIERVQVTFRFDVDESGHVRGVDLSPASTAGTPLGACLLGVARGTRFGPLPRAASFSIPVAVRRGGDETP
ncbi:MAG: serine/threonine protein kinase [Sandaracinaceae bacterium]|nr:serine/threonine protein kinase [Sandaracinaceae bacterium]